MTLLDTNIVIDLIERRSPWSPWSQEAVEGAGAIGALAVSAVVAAECATHFPAVEIQREYFDDLGITVYDLPLEAAFRAGHAHRDYRRAGGERTAILADFLIGGHASSLGATLLTRDRARFAVYFPEVPLITPETHL